MEFEAIKITFLEKAIEWITSGAALDLAKLMVTQVMDEDLTGEQKREKVFATLSTNLAGFSTVIINILIEVAVLVMKSQMTSTTKALNAGDNG